MILTLWKPSLLVNWTRSCGPAAFPNLFIIPTVFFHFSTSSKIRTHSFQFTCLSLWKPKRCPGHHRFPCRWSQFLWRCLENTATELGLSPIHNLIALGERFVTFWIPSERIHCLDEKVWFNNRVIFIVEAVSLVHRQHHYWPRIYNLLIRRNPVHCPQWLYHSGHGVELTTALLSH